MGQVSTAGITAANARELGNRVVGPVGFGPPRSCPFAVVCYVYRRSGPQNGGKTMIAHATRASWGFLVTLVLAAAPNATAASTVFYEDFADNDAGWTLGAEWQIGSATGSTGHTYGNPDPSEDYTPTADNGVAGVMIGGNASTDVHPYRFLESPAIDTTSLTGVTLQYARWLNSDYLYFMHNK